jgi:hypothetical protein
LQLPQTPARQEYGKATPARCAASSTVSPTATGNWRPDSLRVTVNVKGIRSDPASMNGCGLPYVRRTYGYGNYN